MILYCWNEKRERVGRSQGGISYRLCLNPKTNDLDILWINDSAVFVMGITGKNEFVLLAIDHF